MAEDDLWRPVRCRSWNGRIRALRMTAYCNCVPCRTSNGGSWRERASPMQAWRFCKARQPALPELDRHASYGRRTRRHCQQPLPVGHTLPGANTHFRSRALAAAGLSSPVHAVAGRNEPNTPIGDRDMVSLARLTSLQELMLDGTLITQRGMQTLDCVTGLNKQEVDRTPAYPSNREILRR